MTIYRIEHPDSEVGPYGHCGSSAWRTRQHDATTGHPDPFDDFGPAVPWSSWAGHIFGFDSLDALTRWFDAEERANLRRLGLVLAVFDAEPTHRSSYQLVFKRPDTPPTYHPIP